MIFLNFDFLHAFLLTRRSSFVNDFCSDSIRWDDRWRRRSFWTLTFCRWCRTNVWKRRNTFGSTWNLFNQRHIWRLKKHHHVVFFLFYFTRDGLAKLLLALGSVVLTVNAVCIGDLFWLELFRLACCWFVRSLWNVKSARWRWSERVVEGFEFWSTTPFVIGELVVVFDDFVVEQVETSRLVGIFDGFEIEFVSIDEFESNTMISKYEYSSNSE